MSPIVTPEPTETTEKERTQKERTPSPVDLCMSKIEVKKMKRLGTKGYKLPAACTFSQDPRDILRSVQKQKPGEHRQMVPAHQTIFTGVQMPKVKQMASHSSLDDIEQCGCPPADLRMKNVEHHSRLGLFGKRSFTFKPNTFTARDSSTPAVDILASQQLLLSKHSMSPDYGRKPSRMFTTLIILCNIFFTMGLKDRSSQKHKTSVDDDADFRGLSTFSNLHIKKKKETEKVGDGSSKKKSQFFDWDVTMLRSSSQESMQESKSQKRSMLLPLNNDNSPAKKSCSLPVSASPMKPSLFGENIQEPLFKQNETFKQPPMNLPSDDAESENGEDTTPYGGDDDIIGTDEENDLLKDDADENKEPDVCGTEDNQTKVDSLSIHFNTEFWLGCYERS